MRLVFRFFVNLLLIIIVLIATFNLLGLIALFFLPALNRYVAEEILSPLVMSEISPEVEEIFRFCDGNKENLNFVSVTKYLESLPPSYYTWRIAEDGAEREKAYYATICKVSLQVDGRVTDYEAKKLSERYIVPEIELFFGLVSRWWLWILAFFSLRSLIVSFRQFIGNRKKTTEEVK